LDVVQTLTTFLPVVLQLHEQDYFAIAGSGSVVTTEWCAGGSCQVKYI
jgi:hypothetical protein